MTVLVLGAGGRLGGHVVAAGGRPSTRAELDGVLASEEALAAHLAGASAVVNCAAQADVDLCERDRDGAWAINAAFPDRLARTCARLGMPLLHVSTDYVFGGVPGPFDEGAHQDPINAYGRSKADGERAVLAAGGHVVRVSWLFGAASPFARWVASQVPGGVVRCADQQSRPTPIAPLGRWLHAAALHVGQGGAAPSVLHPTGGPATSRGEWARRLLEAWGEQAAIEVQAEPFGVAPRPRDTRLDGRETLRWAEAAGLPAIDDWRDAVRSGPSWRSPPPRA
jgi:dTDP-4-dehydrorhamnose reductase